MHFQIITCFITYKNVKIDLLDLANIITSVVISYFMHYNHRIFASKCYTVLP